MNFLIFFENEISVDKKSAKITDKERISYINEKFVLEKDKLQNAGIFEGRLGTTIFKGENERGELEFEVDFNKVPFKKNSVEILISVCRPQTNKKIFHIAQSLGVKEISFVKTDNIPKSYLTSKSLEKENILKECLLAMEQTGDTIMPKVNIYNSLKDYFDKRNVNGKVCIVADTTCDTEKILKSEEINHDAFYVLAIGPESGWSESELELFSKNSFESISLGERILRVEMALSCLVSKVIK